MNDRYRIIPNLDDPDDRYHVWDDEQLVRIAKCSSRPHALHICQVLNGFNALVSAVKQ